MTDPEQIVREMLCKHGFDGGVKPDVVPVWKANAAITGACREAMRRQREIDAEIARECYHGPGDHGCDHGRAIAAAIEGRE